MSTKFNVDMYKNDQVTRRYSEGFKLKVLAELKYNYRPDIVDGKAIEQNFKTKFETLNRVHLTESEFICIGEEIINPDVIASSKLFRENNYLQRDFIARLIEYYFFILSIIKHNNIS
jgi:hypothetical protein